MVNAIHDITLSTNIIYNINACTELLFIIDLRYDSLVVIFWERVVLLAFRFFVCYS